MAGDGGIADEREGLGNRDDFFGNHVEAFLAEEGGDVAAVLAAAFGHGFRTVDRGAESGVCRRVCASGLGGKGDFICAFAEDPAFDGVDSGFDMFDL